MPPCEAMTITSTVGHSKSKPETGYDRTYLQINLHYDTGTYKVIKNSKSFNLESLWSQIGGFIGIFLGYSLLQLPDIVSNSLTRIKNIIKETQRQRNQQLNMDTAADQTDLENTTSPNSASEITRLNSESVSSTRRSNDVEMCRDASCRTTVLREDAIVEETSMQNEVNNGYYN